MKPSFYLIYICRSFSIGALVVLFSNCFSQTINDLNLTGSWKVSDENTYETWVEEGDSLVGVSYKVNYGVREIQEYMTIKQVENNLVYLATVPNQNEGKTIAFQLNPSIPNRFQFENFAHDFPHIIAYQPTNDSTLLVSIKNTDQQGFDLTLEKTEEPKTIPTWFMNHLQNEIGVWIADNSAYFNETEPYISYGLEWKKSVDNTSVVGELYGLTADGDKELFWELRQYWDNETNRAAFDQFGRGGMNGKGYLEKTDENTFEIIQTFSIPNGYEWEEKHENIISATTMSSTSYHSQNTDSWKKKRTMIWEKQ